VAYSQAQLDAIERAISAGVKRVTYDGHSVEYQSVAEMRRIRDDIRRALGVAPPSRRRYGEMSRGL